MKNPIHILKNPNLFEKTLIYIEIIILKFEIIKIIFLKVINYLKMI